MNREARSRILPAALAALIIGAAGCSGSSSPSATPNPTPPNVSTDPGALGTLTLAAPTHDDFVAVTTTPAGVWVSGASSFDLSAAPEGLTSTAGWARETLLCMRRFAAQAYDGEGASMHDDCSLKAVPWNSTEVMKLWDTKTAVAGGPQTIVIAFAGGHVLRIEDVVRDLRDQRAVEHANALDPALAKLPGVANGWATRWDEQAAKLKPHLDWYIDVAQKDGRTLNIHVVGHSAGAAVAMLAGYDLDRYLSSRPAGPRWRVSVHAFDPPRLGDTATRDLYQDALLATSQPQGTSCPAATGQTCLLLHQLTRGTDPVLSEPAGMSHPLWSAPAPARCDRKLGPGPHETLSLGYCAQLNMPRLGYWNALDDHSLVAWDQQLKDATDAELANGLFAVR